MCLKLKLLKYLFNISPIFLPSPSWREAATCASLLCCPVRSDHPDGCSELERTAGAREEVEWVLLLTLHAVFQQTEFCFYKYHILFILKEGSAIWLGVLRPNPVCQMPLQGTSPWTLLPAVGCGLRGPLGHPVRALLRNSLASSDTSHWVLTVSKLQHDSPGKNPLPPPNQQKPWIFLVLFLLDFSW